MDPIVHRLLMDEARHLLPKRGIGHLIQVIAHGADEEPFGRRKAQGSGVEQDLQRTAGGKPRTSRHRRKVNVDPAANDRGGRSLHVVLRVKL
jgi:hypothetical protein